MSRLFAKLTDLNGQPLLINPDKISCVFIEREKNNVTISLDSGQTIVVIETLSYVMRQMSVRTL